MEKSDFLVECTSRHVLRNKERHTCFEYV